MTSPRARTRARDTLPLTRLRRRHRMILAIVAVASLALALASVASASTAYLAGQTGGHSALLPINLATNTPGTTIALPGNGATAVVVSPDSKTVYALGINFDTNDGFVAPVNTETNVVGTPIEAAHLGEPEGAAISPDGKTMYVATQAFGVVPVNLEAGTVGTPITLPGAGVNGASGGIAFSADGATAYVAGAERVYKINVASGSVEAEANPGLGVLSTSKHLALSPDGNTIWSTPGENFWVNPIEAATMTAETHVTLGGKGTNEAFAPDGSKLWVLATGNTSFLVPVDPTAHTAGTSISFAGKMFVQSFGNGLAIAPSGKTAYVSSENMFAAVNLQSGMVETPIEIPIFSDAMAVAKTVNPAGAATPTITTTEPTQSAVVGDPTNPTMTINIGQLDENGERVPPEDLTVTATTENGPVSIEDHLPSHLPAENVTITGEGSERTVHFDPVSPGISFVTLTVSGEGGKTASIKFPYAISRETTPTSRVLEDGSDESTGIEAGEGDILVADDELSFINLFNAEQSGMPVRSYNIGTEDANEVDFEASAKVGNTIYWLGSHDNTKSGFADTERQQVIATEVTGSGDSTQLKRTGDFTGLLTDMIAWTRGEGNPLGLYKGPISSTNSSESAVNIEGAEFAPNSSSEMYLGLREPMVEVDGKKDAIIVPVTNINRVVEGTEAHAKFAAPILLDLDGMAIREIRKNAAGQYLIIGGVYSGPNNKKIEQALFSWTGERGDQPVRLTTPMPESEEEFDEDPAAWEGIGQMPANLTVGSQVRLIEDEGETRPYLPDEHTKSKQMTEMQWRKSRTDLFTLEGKVGAEVSATAPTFAAQAANTVGAPQWVTVTNSGSQKLVVERVSTSDSDGVSASDFLVSQDECVGKTIAVGGTCKVRVRFAPSSVDTTSNADLVLEGNVDDGAAMVPLRATSTTLPTGEPGPTGPAGSTGPAGPAGSTGPTGSAGATGAAGPTGAAGTDGTDGTNGTNGTNGAQGPAGPKGDVGAKGEAGTRGEKGERGEKGAPGKNGTVSFTADRSSALVEPGGTAGLAFVLRNGTAGALPGGSAKATMPKGLKVGGKRTVTVAALGAGHSRKVTLRLKVAGSTPAGTYKVPVELTVGGHSVTTTVTLRVRG